MPKPGEHKTVQARILEYARQIGWTYVPRAEAVRVQPHASNLSAAAQGGSLDFDELRHEEGKSNCWT